MKKVVLMPILLCFAVFTTISCIKEETEEVDLSKDSIVKLDTITFTHSMKGWELYSWPVSTKWKYSLMMGTNATKTYSQIINNYISVIGEDSLKVLLSKLPSDEEIMWLGQVWLQNCGLSSPGELKLPPRAIQIEIKEFCDNHNLRLTIVE